MELDFEAVKALSSPTRVRILRQVLDRERTTTQLSDELEKSKSTVSSHLTTLVDAGLLERDKVEGRKRVTYHPTAKAEAIVQGRERKVKFSIASSIVTSFAGFALVGYTQLDRFMTTGSSAAQLSQESDQMGAMTTMERGAEAAPKVAEAANSGLMTPENAFLFAGIGLLTIAVAGLLYGLVMRELG
jgi:DNA-binding transcriptional ArsR family regulator